MSTSSEFRHWNCNRLCDYNTNRSLLTVKAVDDKTAKDASRDLGGKLCISCSARRHYTFCKGEEQKAEALDRALDLEAILDLERKKESARKGATEDTLDTQKVSCNPPHDDELTCGSIIGHSNK